MPDFVVPLPPVFISPHWGVSAGLVAHDLQAFGPPGMARKQHRAQSCHMGPRARLADIHIEHRFGHAAKLGRQALCQVPEHVPVPDDPAMHMPQADNMYNKQRRPEILRWGAAAGEDLDHLRNIVILRHVHC